jgi:hypothetical protein
VSGLFRGKPPVIADEERREELELAAASGARHAR